MIRSGRFAIVPARAIDDTRMTHTALAVLVALGTVADRDGWCGPLDSRRIGRRLTMTPQAVDKQLDALDGWGYLARQGDRMRMLQDGTLPRAFDRWRDQGDEDFVDPPTPVLAEVVSTPAPPPPADPNDFRARAALIVDGMLADPALHHRPTVSRVTIEKLVARALAAGNPEWMIDRAMPRVRVWTRNGMDIALADVAERASIATPIASGPVCDICQGQGYVLDDAGEAVRCTHGAVA